MTLTFQTTPDEDAAILALGLDDTPQDFATRHLRHQIDYALSQATKTLEQKYAAATPEDKAAIDAILAPKVPPVK
jgi:hypothetical protein